MIIDSEILSDKGFLKISSVLSRSECQKIQALYNKDTLFRSTINMQRYRFGKGEYRYFSYPLPTQINKLRAEFYEALSGIANEWMKQLNNGQVYPQTHKDFIETCRLSNQHRPTPLILKYDAGGYNTLHQDLYGDIYFPFQVVIVLTQRGIDHEGGELVFVEQHPRAQSKAEVVTADQGDAIIFTTNFRPIKGSRGYYRAKMKHGISQVTTGTRYSLGIIFHDAA